MLLVLETLKGSEITKRKSYPHSKSSKQDVCPCTQELALTFITHKVLNILRTHFLNPPKISGDRQQVGSCSSDIKTVSSPSPLI
jgi:hypothetical protein